MAHYKNINLVPKPNVLKTSIPLSSVMHFDKFDPLYWILKSRVLFKFLHILTGCYCLFFVRGLPFNFSILYCKSDLCFLFVVLACAYVIIMSNIKIPTKRYKARGHGFARFLFKIENMIQNIFLFKRYVYFLDFPGICTTSFYSLQTWKISHKYSLNLYTFNNQ